MNIIPRIGYCSSNKTSNKTLLLLVWLFPVLTFLGGSTASAFTSSSGGVGWHLPTNQQHQHQHHHGPITKRTTACWGSASTPSSDDSDNEIVDVDFERVVVESSSSSTTTDEFPPSESFETLGDDDDMNQKKTLLDLSLDADPRWKTARIPFCRGDEYIDAKLAFMVELEGVQYGIAVPYDDAVAVIVSEGTASTATSKKDGNDDGISVTYVDPDAYHENEEYQELMEIMAVQVQKELGEEFMLRKTPKVLTISGGLSELTNKWEKDIFGKPASIEELLKATQTNDESIDDEVSDFLSFMKSELGEEEFEKTMNEEPSGEDQELMKFFNVAGVGENKDDTAALEDLIKSMEDDLEENKGVRAQAAEMAPDTDGLSLKLISFDFGGGKKSYSLVKLLTPYVLVGKYCEEEEMSIIDAGDESSSDTNVIARGDIRFDLLTAEEERVLIPKLEQVCKEDLSKAGLSLGENSRTK
jgi:hypothetical protein